MNILAIMLATTVNFTVQTAVHPDDFKTYDTAKTRERFVMEKVMAPCTTASSTAAQCLSKRS